MWKAERRNNKKERKIEAQLFCVYILRILKISVECGCVWKLCNFEDTLEC